MTYDVGSEEKKVFVASEILIDSTAIEEAYVTSSGTSTDHLGITETLYGVALVFTDAGAEKMKKITESRISKPLAILLDGDVLSAPVVRANIGDSHNSVTAPPPLHVTSSRWQKNELNLPPSSDRLAA